MNKAEAADGEEEPKPAGPALPDENEAEPAPPFLRPLAPRVLRGCDAVEWSEA